MDLVVAEIRVGRDDAALDGLGQDSVAVQAAAVVADFDDDAASVVEGAQHQSAPGRFAGRQSPLGRFDAVVHGVAHQMGERVADLLDHTLVQLGVGAADHQLDVLAQLAR
jgi:hypothetical protein